MDTEEGMKSVIVDSFSKMYNEGPANFDQVTKLMSRLVTNDDNAMLTAPFSSEEIKSAINQMHLDK